MVYFLIIPLWLVGLVVCAALASFKSTRALAIYVSMGGTGAVLMSLLMSTLVVMAPAALGLSIEGAGAALLLMAGYIVGVVGGGLAGAGLGVLLAWRLTGRRRLIRTAERP